LTEQVDVGVVHGEVKEDGASSTVDPQVIVKLLNDSQGVGLVVRKILVVSTTAIAGDFAFVVRSVDVIGFGVFPGSLAGIDA
jgi:hypothetical protein